jgi:hypothetical protein
LSKRKDKIEAARVEQTAFLKVRKIKQYSMLEQAYKVGLKLYEDNKDKLNSAEIEQIEKMKTEQLATLEKLKNEINQDSKA